jgi:hypothetical protein
MVLGWSFAGQWKRTIAGFVAAKLGGRQAFVKWKRMSGLQGVFSAKWGLKYWGIGY